MDLAFIDGLHLFEFSLRDFMNVEKLAHPGSVVVFDDAAAQHRGGICVRRSRLLGGRRLQGRLRSRVYSG